MATQKTASLTTQIIGMDPGFHGYKIAWLNSAHAIRTALVPSVVGIGQITDLSHLGLGKRKPKETPLALSFQNGGAPVSYLVGPGVHHYAEPVSDLDYQRLSDSLATRSLTYAALGQALNGHPTEVRLMVGFPIEVTADRDKFKDTVKGLRGWAVGQHRFSLDGRQVEAGITQVKAVAQPVGAYFDWGMDAAGEWVQPEASLEMPIAVLDIGFNTIDLFAVQNGQIVNRYTGGNNLGMHRVARTVARFIDEQHDIRLGLHQADDIVKEFIARKQASLFCADGEVDLSGIIAQALEQNFTAINEFVSERWQNGRQFYRLLITGGGAEALREQFLTRYPAAYIPPEPVFANARGLLKWGLRVLR